MENVNEEALQCLEVQGRINVLSTASRAGAANVALFGSVMRGPDWTVKVLLGDNRTHANLRENPNAALLVIKPGATGLQTEGVRLYLRVKGVEDAGEEFGRLKAAVKARVGDAAEALRHLVTFDVLMSRPIVDERPTG